MPSLHSPTIALRRLRGRLARLFFGGFFRFLVVAVSLSEWCVIWWLFPDFVESLPAAGQVTGPLLFYIINQALAVSSQPLRRHRVWLGPARRCYYAFAFTSLFCASFLAVTGVLWMAAKGSLGAIAQARTAGAGLLVDSNLDTSFRWLANAGMAVISIAFAYGYTIGQWRLRITRLRLPLRHCPPALNGLRIVQVSDIHIGQNLTRKQLAGFVARVNELRPDLICITGDIIDSPSARIESSLQVLAQLHAPYGVFAILGNHDHYAGAARVEALLRRCTGFTVLRDQRTAITIRGHRLHIVGLDDRGRDWARGVKGTRHLTATLAAIAPCEPVLLLSHRPDIFAQAAAAGVALTLSGHTHGGQIGVPWFNGRVRNLAEFVTRFDRGLFERDGRYLYVNCGLGVTGQRVRLCTPREITLIQVQNLPSRALAA
ncbi:MAG: metallophosphoesterase [Candidatus Binatia bacterium]